MKKEIFEIIDSNLSLTDKLQSLCYILADNVSYYCWVGFYLVSEKKNTLILGPYVGEITDHTEIPFGRGICGQVALSHKTFVVPDVEKQDNYLSCNMKVKSEIVIPIFDTKGEFVAQLDIDSHVLDPFTQEDKDLLEEICERLGKYFDS